MGIHEPEIKNCLDQISRLFVRSLSQTSTKSSHTVAKRPLQKESRPRKRHAVPPAITASSDLMDLRVQTLTSRQILTGWNWNWSWSCLLGESCAGQAHVSPLGTQIGPGQSSSLLPLGDGPPDCAAQQFP
eukprot:701473-Rhodomonas_salina.1